MIKAATSDAPALRGGGFFSFKRPHAAIAKPPGHGIGPRGSGLGRVAFGLPKHLDEVGLVGSESDPSGNGLAVRVIG